MSDLGPPDDLHFVLKKQVSTTPLLISSTRTSQPPNLYLSPQHKYSFLPLDQSIEAKCLLSNATPVKWADPPVVHCKVSHLLRSNNILSVDRSFLMTAVCGTPAKTTVKKYPRLNGDHQNHPGTQAITYNV